MELNIFHQPKHLRWEAESNYDSTGQIYKVKLNCFINMSEELDML